MCAKISGTFGRMSKTAEKMFEMPGKTSEISEKINGIDGRIFETESMTEGNWTSEKICGIGVRMSGIDGKM